MFYLEQPVLFWISLTLGCDLRNDDPCFLLFSLVLLSVSLEFLDFLARDIFMYGF